MYNSMTDQGNTIGASSIDSETAYYNEDGTANLSNIDRWCDFVDVSSTDAKY